VIFYHYIF